MNTLLGAWLFVYFTACSIVIITRAVLAIVTTARWLWTRLPRRAPEFTPAELAAARAELGFHTETILYQSSASKKVEIDSRRVA